MGYYTTIEVSLAVKPGKKKEFEETVASLREGKVSGEYAWLDRYQDMELDGEGCLQFQEYFRKFYDAGSLAGFLSPYVNAGEIRCWGEDTEDIWRIVFDGQGNHEIQDGRIVYDGRLKLPYEK
jgi:hypothetical protein